jgi:hypothetical protein
MDILYHKESLNSIFPDAFPEEEPVGHSAQSKKNSTENEIRSAKDFN